MRAIVVGIDSLVGRALGEALSARGDTVYGTTRRSAEASAGTAWFLDLAAHTAAVDLPRVDVAYICAAVTSLADCRASPDRARLVNLRAPAQLAARWTRRTIFLSTNAVFDCQAPLMGADRPRRPTTLYGKLKAEAEDAVLASSGTVVRLTKIFVPEMPLLRRWHGALAQGDAIEAAADHRVAPILLGHLIDALLGIADKGEGGIYQVSASGDVSYAEIALWMADRLKVDRSRVMARSAVEIGIPADEVLPYTSLDASRLDALLGLASPDPSVAIELVLDSLG